MPDALVIVTNADMERLSRLIRALKHSLLRDQQQLDLLDQTLAAAEVRPSARVPKDVIRMNSRVRVFDFDTRRRGLYTLAFPQEADVSKGVISVLAPLGIALIGRKRGDVVLVQVPAGARKLKVEGVRQPPESHCKARPAAEAPHRPRSQLIRTQDTALAV